MLKIEKARLVYQQHVIFNSLSLDIEEGECLAILGRSGVGKSSLLRMIAGLHRAFVLPQTEIGGKISWHGKDELSGDIAYMAQQEGLFPWLSIIDNLLVVKRLQGLVPESSRAEYFLKSVGLGAHLHKKPSALSGGMRQRVALARVMMQDKPIILMDEPYAALDAMTRLEMQALFFKMFRSLKKTVIMVTHDPWEALRLADRVLVLGGVPAEIHYRVHLPTSSHLRSETPALLSIYQELLKALGHGRDE